MSAASRNGSRAGNVLHLRFNQRPELLLQLDDCNSKQRGDETRWSSTKTQTGCMKLQLLNQLFRNKNPLTWSQLQQSVHPAAPRGSSDRSRGSSCGGSSVFSPGPELELLTADPGTVCPRISLPGAALYCPRRPRPPSPDNQSEWTAAGATNSGAP